MTMFIESGVTALANVVEQDGQGWFQGHVGASFLAGAALLEGGLLPPAAADSLRTRLERQQQKYRALLAPLPASDVATDYSLILNAIARNTRQLSRSGHGVIYGALLLDTLQRTSVAVTKNAVANIARLIDNCASDKWDRYAGIADYRTFRLPEPVGMDIEALCVLAVKRSTHQVYHDVDGYFLTGEKIHGITHAHAIYLLSALGYDELATQAASQLAVQLALNDRLPDTALRCAQPKPFSVADAAVWAEDFSDEHQIKLAYSYLDLCRKIRRPLARLDNLWGAIR
ncbi:hypothetical protein OI70_01270 [Dickeya fangzhongdai]|uniref:hypothetical protein n=1 Tax=Dickeya fangzhongdai TaxID=1778540 RepID=UPI000575AE90|nr:hypothetical protein [Dickeya fangzhongdai]KHN62522.1 hypothetical protein OI70_01270 [Dickeya fangzhongdai]